MSNILLHINGFTVNIDGDVYSRANLTVTPDGGAETLTIVDNTGPVTLLDAVGYADITADGVVFASFSDMVAWAAIWLNPAHALTALNGGFVDIDGSNLRRILLAITTDDVNETLTVIDTSGPTTLIDAVDYFNVIANNTLFDSYAAMVAWVALNVAPTAFDAVDNDNVSIDGVTYLRDDLITRIARDNITIVNKTIPDYPVTIIDSLKYNNIKADGVTLVSADAMFAWAKAHLWPEETQYLDSDTYVIWVNGKPYPLNSLYLAWNDTAQELEIRIAHNDNSDKPMSHTHYSNIVMNGEYVFPSYDALVKYVGVNFFTH